jgi:hypothetical protein
MFHVERYFSAWKSVFEAWNCSMWNIEVFIGGKEGEVVPRGTSLSRIGTRFATRGGRRSTLKF